MAYFLLSILAMEIKGKMDFIKNGIDVYAIYSFISKSIINQLFYITMTSSLMAPALVTADISNKHASGLKSSNEFLKHTENDVISDDISCGVDFKASYLDGSKEIRTNNRETLLNSVDERLIKSCEMGYEEVKRRLLSKSIELVDTRPAQTFASYRIDGSLNMSAFEIKSKGYLKDKHLVIVGDSANLLESSVLCRDLKQNGFKKVNFIKGGIGAWNDKLVGRDAHSIERWMLGKITPRKFVSLKSKMEWLVLDISNDDLSEKKSGSNYDDLKVVPLVIDDVNNLNKVRGHTDSFLNKALYGFLVVSRNGERYSEAENYLNTHNINNVYYLDGGAEAYSKYMSERKVFLARLKRGPVQSKSCSSI